MGHWTNLPRDNRCEECGRLTPPHLEAGRMEKRVPICDPCNDRLDTPEPDNNDDLNTYHDTRGEDPPHDSVPLGAPDIAW